MGLWFESKRDHQLSLSEVFREAFYFIIGLVTFFDYFKEDETEFVGVDKFQFFRIVDWSRNWAISFWTLYKLYDQAL